MYSVRVIRHMDAQQYYESLLAQGYTPEDSTKYTQEHYPDFGQESAPAAPEPAAPNPLLQHLWQYLLRANYLRLRQCQCPVPNL